MKDYLLDTNICAYALKNHPRVCDAIVSKPASTLWVSVITEAELRAGVAKSSAVRKKMRALEGFLGRLQVMEFKSEDAIAYARIRADLEMAGTPIGPLDTLIGAHAVSRGLTLVTNNEREFRRIEGLVLENWTA